MNDFEIGCSECDNEEKSDIEFEGNEKQLQILEKLNTLINFKVIKVGKTHSLKCLNCGHEYVFLKDETSDILDMSATSQGFTQKVKTVKMIGDYKSDWGSWLLILLLLIGFLTGVMQSSFDLLGFNFYTLLSLIIVLLYIPLHEVSHFVVAKALKYNPTLHLLSNKIDTPIKKNHLLLIVLTPLVLLTVVYLTLIYFGSSYSGALYMAMALNISGCKQDIRQALATLKCPKGSYIYSNSKNEIRAYKRA